MTAEQLSKICTKCSQEFSSDTLVCPDDGADLIPKAAELLVGTLFDQRYRILAFLGHGGMGAVYKAQHESLRQTVAIKMLHSNLLSSEEDLRRFEREGQALSILSHRNVVSAHDFGVAPGGQPYLVMHYIEGKGLDQVIQAEGSLNPVRVAEIFLQVCDGLIHAHRKGIVHRDLKPGNITLVEEDGESDVVKILDFGFAKLLPDSQLQGQKLTQTGHIFGSPSYMSPEQWRGNKIDARSDIYSLGCAMYEALSGKPPLEIEDVLSVMLDKREIQPPALKTIKPDAQISTELETLVFKAMAVQLDKRYQSVNELRQDLERAPECETIKGQLTAKKNHTLRWLHQRERRAVLTRVLILLVVLLLVALGTATWIGSTGSGGVIETRLSFLLEGLVLPPADPHLFALQRRLADLYFQEGKYVDAAREYEIVMPYLASKFGADSAEVADFDDRLTEVYSKLNGKEAMRDSYALKAVRLFNALGAKYEKQWPLDKAILYYRKALRNRERLATKQGREIPWTLLQLANLEYNQGNHTGSQQYYSQAERDYQQALDKWRSMAIPDKLGMAMTLYGLGNCYCKEHLYDKAEPMLEEALDLAPPIFGATNRILCPMVDDLESVALNYYEKGPLSKSVPLFERVSAMKEKLYGPSSLDVGQSYSRLAYALAFDGKPRQAETLFRKALAVVERARGPDDQETAAILLGLAGSESHQGKYVAACQDFDRTIQICKKQKKLNDLEHQILQNALNGCAESLEMMGRAAEGSKLREEALQLPKGAN